MNTNEAIQQLKNEVAISCGEHWARCARFRPLTDDPEGPFRVEAVVPGETIFVGEYRPSDLDEEGIVTLANEVQIVREASLPREIPAAIPPSQITDRDDDALYTKAPTVELANGMTVSGRIWKKAMDVNQFEQASQRKAEEIGMVTFESEVEDAAYWQGQKYEIHPGQNTIPRGAWDNYVQGRKAYREAKGVLSRPAQFLGTVSRASGGRPG